MADVKDSHGDRSRPMVLVSQADKADRMTLMYCMKIINKLTNLAVILFS